MVRKASVIIEKDEHGFYAWCPDTRKVVNRATTAFRNAETTLLKSQSYLGAQYRRLRTRLGAPAAITALARKLACLYYRLIKHGQQYVDKGTEYSEAKFP